MMGKAHRCQHVDIHNPAPFANIPCASEGYTDKVSERFLRHVCLDTVPRNARLH